MFRFLIVVCFLFFFFYCSGDHRDLHSFPTRRSSDLLFGPAKGLKIARTAPWCARPISCARIAWGMRSEEHTSELQSHSDLVCRLLLEKKNKHNPIDTIKKTHAAWTIPMPHSHLYLNS